MSATLTPRRQGIVIPMVSMWSEWGVFGKASITATTPGSTTWVIANRTIYSPVWVPTTCVATRVWWVNGGTVSGGATIQAGIYANVIGDRKPGAKLVSGSATQGTANNVQFVDTTDLTLPPNLYWIALTMSSVTNTTGFGGTISTSTDATWRYQEASAMPSTATPVVSTDGTAWLFGFSTNTVT